jgi:hypothetical protein
MIRKEKAVKEKREPFPFGPPSYLEAFEMEKLKQQVLSETMQDHPLELNDIAELVFFSRNVFY